MTAMPTANPTGRSSATARGGARRVRDRARTVPLDGSPAHPAWIQAVFSPGRQCRGDWRNEREVLSNPAVAVAGNQFDAVLGPAPVDEVADLRAHLDLVGPRPGALLGPLRGGVDPELAADELALGRVVEMVERPLERTTSRAGSTLAPA